MKPMTRMEKIVGWLSGRAIFYLIRKAEARRDWHEYNHLHAALVTGNTGPNHKCNFPEALYHGPVTWGEVQPYKQGGKVQS